MSKYCSIDGHFIDLGFGKKFGILDSKKNKDSEYSRTLYSEMDIPGLHTIKNN